ncbi:MAG: UDP-2,3-diacylglucosamine diphosphatase LpxI [Alphaproteobacteria bacterium]|nr:UDP-2,3-diacylglucosamine diphosphatase LpxI [Alphaproteobacteria bacterium]
MAAWTKLGVIAGGGELPVRIVEHCASTGAPYYVARIVGVSDAVLSAHPGGDFGLGEMDARFRALREAGCDAVTFVGIVKRPDFKSLKLDARAALMMPRVLSAARKGDDALLRVLGDEHEREGFRLVGADEVLAALLAPAGALGAVSPDALQLEDIAKGGEVAAALGAWDVGQGCVVCDGLVLALEAQEGTDEMLARVAGLPIEIRGASGAPRGVLVKCPKPIQDRRIDLPTIGLPTIEAVARAGLAGIAVEAGGALVMQREALIVRADELGLFVYGFAP